MYFIYICAERFAVASSRLDSICTVMAVWRIRKRIIITVSQCTFAVFTVYHCARSTVLLQPEAGVSESTNQHSLQCLDNAVGYQEECPACKKQSDEVLP